MAAGSQPGAATDALTVLDRLRAQGFVVLHDLVPPALIDRVNHELTPWFDKTPRCHGHFYGWNTTRFGSVLTKAPSTQELAALPDLLSIMDAVLGPNCDWYQLNLSQAVRIHPDSPQQPPHRDEEMWPTPKSFEHLVNVMWALDDFTEENGATRLWPRSQFGALTREPEPEQAMVAEMPRGSALVFLGSLTHCGGANISGGHRTGLIFSYCLGWLKQYENQFLAYPPDVAKDFPKPLRDLIGYRIHRPNLGGYENQCPSVLFEGRPDTLPAVDCLPPEVQAELEELNAKHAA